MVVDRSSGASGPVGAQGGHGAGTPHPPLHPVPSRTPSARSQLCGSCSASMRGALRYHRDPGSPTFWTGWWTARVKRATRLRWPLPLVCSLSPRPGCVPRKPTPAPILCRNACTHSVSILPHAPHPSGAVPDHHRQISSLGKYPSLKLQQSRLRRWIPVLYHSSPPLLALCWFCLFQKNVQARMLVLANSYQVIPETARSCTELTSS